MLHCDSSLRRDSAFRYRAPPRTCRFFAGKISPPPTACPTTTSSAYSSTDNRVWAGTENGLGLYENGIWKVFRPAADRKSKAWRIRPCLSLALDKRTGDVWAGTMGGLSRISAGRIDTFTQLTSGLSNDIVYGVGVQGDFVWTATAAGASRLNTRTGRMGAVQRTQHAHAGNLDLRRQSCG